MRCTSIYDCEKELLDALIEQLSSINVLHRNLAGDLFFKSEDFKDFMFKLVSRLNLYDDPLDLTVRKKLYITSDDEYEVKIIFTKIPAKHEEEEVSDALKREAEKEELC